MNFYLETDHPVAVDSPDHIRPLGTVRDNTSNPFFNKLILEMYDHKPSVLDLGCAGGGLVRSLILDSGCVAVGLEGSDYNLIHQRAEWSIVPDNLFTCDISHPFKLHTGDGAPFKFDVVTAWEFVEHLPQERIPVMLYNVRLHLVDGGLLIGSTTDGCSVVRNVDYHQTMKPVEWWYTIFEAHGFKRREDLEQTIEDRWAWVRQGKYRFAVEKVT